MEVNKVSFIVKSWSSPGYIRNIRAFYNNRAQACEDKTSSFTERKNLQLLLYQFRIKISTGGEKGSTFSIREISPLPPSPGVLFANKLNRSMIGLLSIKRKPKAVFCRERRYNTWIRIGHKALFVIPYCTNAARALRVVTTTMFLAQLCYPRQWGIPDREKRYKYMGRGRNGKTLSMPNTKGSAGHSGSFELATERITQRTNAEQRIFLR